MKHPASITSLINCGARAYMKNGNMSEAKALRLLGNVLNWIAFLPWLLVMGGINELNHDSSDFGAWLEIALGAALSILLGSAGAKYIKKAKKLSALDAAIRVLAETGQAMHCSELIVAMAAQGYPTCGVPAQH